VTISRRGHQLFLEVRGISAPMPVAHLDTGPTSLIEVTPVSKFSICCRMIG